METHAPNSNNPGAQSTAELVKQLGEQTSALVRKEVELAKAELSEKSKQAGAGAGMFGTAGVLALLGVAAITAAVILLLDNAVADWVAALIIGALYLAGGAVAALRGRDRMREAGPMAPEQTVETLKEDVQWAKNQAKSARR